MQQQVKRIILTDTQKKCMGEIKGGGGEGELRAKDISHIMQQQSKTWTQPRRQPGVLDRGRLVTWIREQRGKISATRWLVCNTQVEKTGNEIGHWVLIEHYAAKEMRIWDPLEEPVEGTVFP